MRSCKYCSNSPVARWDKIGRTRTRYGGTQEGGRGHLWVKQGLIRWLSNSNRGQLGVFHSLPSLIMLWRSYLVHFIGLSRVKIVKGKRKLVLAAIVWRSFIWCHLGTPTVRSISNQTEQHWYTTQALPACFLFLKLFVLSVHGISGKHQVETSHWELRHYIPPIIHDHVYPEPKYEIFSKYTSLTNIYKHWTRSNDNDDEIATCEFLTENLKSCPLSLSTAVSYLTINSDNGQDSQFCHHWILNTPILPQSATT